MMFRKALTRNRGDVRKLVMVLMILGLMTTSATGALAKGKPQPKPDPHYSVKIDVGENDQGLSTAPLCQSGGALDMRLAQKGKAKLLIAVGTSFTDDPNTSDADLFMRASFGSLAFDGCSYGTSPSSGAVGPGFFRLEFGTSGVLETITWHFDNEAVVTPRRNGKGSNLTVLHKYALTTQQVTQAVTWDQLMVGTVPVVAIFELWDYTNIGAEGSIWTFKGTSEFRLDLTIESTQ